MLHSTDQTGRSLTLARPATRIVSLVPSQTAWLHALGLESEVVGITRFCTEPESWHREKPKVGGTKDVKPERVSTLAPDLIIANKEENVRDQVEALRALCPVWTSDVNDLSSALQMMKAIGELVGKAELASALTEQVTQEFAALDGAFNPLRAAYVIWKDPWMVAGGDTFIHDMMRHCGLVNLFADVNRYPVTDLDEITEKGCDLILLSSEPYPFRDREKLLLASRFPKVRVECTDGRPFSWYGSDLLSAPARFRELRTLLEGAVPYGR